MMKLVTVSFCVFINLWPRPRPWPYELMASLTSLLLTSVCSRVALTPSRERTAVDMSDSRQCCRSLWCQSIRHK